MLVKYTVSEFLGAKGSFSSIDWHNIEITHVYLCINICKVLRKLFEHKVVRESVQPTTDKVYHSKTPFL